jgi:hypothetical protein
MMVKADEALAGRFDLIVRLQNQKAPKSYIFLGQVQRYLLQRSLDSFPLQNVEISYFLNGAPETKSTNPIPLADPTKLGDLNSVTT